MKYKKIMLIALLLLAVLTISAVSAADDFASDDLTASDDVDVIADPDPEGDGNGDGNGDGGDDSDFDDGVSLYCDLEDEFDNDDFDTPFAYGLISESLEGNITITKGDDVFFNRELSDIDSEAYPEREGFNCYKISLNNLTNAESFLNTGEDNWLFKLAFIDPEGGEIDSHLFEIFENEGKYSFDFWDGEDGIIIEVSEDQSFNLSDPEDLEKFFAFVYVLDNEIQGNITITYWNDNEEEDVYVFNEDLSNIVNKEDDDGVTCYKIALKDLNGLDDFKNQESFSISFMADEEIEIDSRDYDIKNIDGVLSFIASDEQNEEEEDVDRGELIDDVVFSDANVITNDVMITIPKKEFLNDVDEEFEVIFSDDEESNSYLLNLSEIESDDSNYYIRVNDIDLEEDIGEGMYVDQVTVQFKKNGVNAYYAETDEEEGIDIYISPLIWQEANTIEGNAVVSFTEIEGVDDEFTVTISKEGSEDVVKTFKISELENLAEEEDEPASYELNCADLGITEGGEYTITVNFTKNGETYISVNNTVSVSDELVIWFEEESLGSIADAVFAIYVPEDMKGYVKVYVDDVQVGDNISFSKLYFMGWGSSHGRQVWLNNFNITETGDYDLKVEVFDENGQFLGNSSVNKHVEVGENTAEFNDVYYTQGGYIIFNLTSPISQDGYFIVYLNGKKAGVFFGNVFEDVEFYDEFVDTLGYGDYDRFLKVGDYEANITYFDGTSESDFATGTFSVKSMNITTDKEKYLENDNVTISFKADQPTEFSWLRVALITGWGLMGPDDHRIFDASGEELANLWKDGVITVNIGNLALGANNLMIEYCVAESEDDMDDENYLIWATDLIKVNVIEPIDPALTIAVSNIVEGNPAVVTITTNATFSGIVVVKIANKEYNVTVTNGKGTLSVPSLAAGSYNATAIFAATGLFAASEKTAQFTVTKKTPVTPTVKKAASKIVAKKKTFKAKTKVKKYTITLKSGKNPIKKVVVTLKVKGKTYKAKTNAKGKAVFKIKNLKKKGKYTATIKFKGNAKYKAATKKVKITVKK